MATASPPTPPPVRNLAELVEHLGGIPLDRIRFNPLPGTATESDLLKVKDDEGITCELIEGILVEKGTGLR